MFNSRIGRTLTEDDPPDSARHRRPGRRLGAILAVASTLAMGVAMTVVAQPAQAITNLDGNWTVVHGGTGQLSLNADGTYTSTCQVTPGYKDAWCPAPSGTFQRGSNAYVHFYGDDGSDNSYRFSGLVSSPDTITTYFGSRTQTPLIMKKGTQFVCTDWGVRDGTPMAYADETGTFLYATGSHDFLGPVDRGNDVAETAPNYFQLGQCGNLYPKMTMASLLHIDNFRDATKPPTAKKWSPRVAVTIKDLAGVPVSGATVSGLFTPDQARFSCLTAADGTCTVRHSPLRNSVTSTEIWVGSVDKPGTAFWQDPGDDPWAPSPVFFTVYNPLVGPPPPAPPPPPPAPPAPPASHHIGDLDNATVRSASSRTWEPRVAVTVLDASGEAVEGAIVNGSFTHVSQGQTCTTEANGTCTMGEYLSLSRSFPSTEFTVTDVIRVSSTYVPTANSDPDGDSNGTTETVERP